MQVHGGSGVDAFGDFEEQGNTKADVEGKGDGQGGGE
jgi:hypothetical protein